MNTRTRLTAVCAATVLGAGWLTAAQPSAQAAGEYPLQGELCTATENIQFYNGDAPSYVVRSGEFIRIDSMAYGAGYHKILGHGEGHSTRSFTWRHSNRASRLNDCH